MPTFLRVLIPVLLAALAIALALPRPPAETIGVSELQQDLQVVDSLVGSWVESEQVPGAVLLVSRGGEILLERAYGSAQSHDYGSGQYDASGSGGSRSGGVQSLPDPPPVTLETVFDLASVTKVMATTFAVMLSVDRGELDLDAPVRAYLPDFRGGG